MSKTQTLNPETHIDPEDYLDLIHEADMAIHFYLKDDKEWGRWKKPPRSRVLVN